MQEFFENFRQELNRYKEQENKRKMRGLHDYNIFRIFFSTHDEVRLHSRFLHSLLDPNSGHCQDEFFLSKFIDATRIENFGFVCQDALVQREYKNIDIYISSGNKHIILENKIYANDQEGQIERYIDIIRNDYQNSDTGNNQKQKSEKEQNNIEIYVLFLSLDERDPSKYSRGKYEFCDDRTGLECVGFKVRYKNITYKKEILNWLGECQRELRNLSDLSVFISHYIDIVKQITNQNLQRDKMHLETIVKNYELATEISENLVYARKEIIDNFFKEVKEILEKNDEIKNYWNVEINGLVANSTYNTPLIIYKKALENQQNYFAFTVEIQTATLKNAYWGFRKNNENIDDCIKFDDLKIYQDEKLKTTQWWIDWKWLSIDNKQLDMDLAKEIKQDLQPDYFAKNIFSIIKKYEVFIDEINNNISKYLVK